MTLMQSKPAYGNRRTIRVEWGDCDPAGIIFNARYFEIFDAATAALFERALRMIKRQMLETYEIAGIPLVRTQARFIKPARFGDDITVDSTIEFGRTSFQVDHRVALNGDVCAEASETRVWVTRDSGGALKPSPIPPAVLEGFRVALAHAEVSSLG
jgi:4-hydroxybenzoyl-CoA thioesterase